MLHSHLKNLAILTVTLFSAFAQAADKHLTFTTAALPPLGSTTQHKGFLEQIAQEAFSRLGYSVEVAILPGERALINANSGIDDGDMYRAPGFEAAYPNLVQVPESIGIMEFMGYSKDKAITAFNWKSLQDYVVAYATGWKIYDRKVKAREVTKVRSIHELFPMLDNGRAEIVLMDRWQGSYIARQQGVSVKLLEPPLARMDMYMYLNKKHANLVPQLVTTLKAMKADGAYQRIYDATLKN